MIVNFSDSKQIMCKIKCRNVYHSKKTLAKILFSAKISVISDLYITLTLYSFVSGIIKDVEFKRRRTGTDLGKGDKTYEVQMFKTNIYRCIGRIDF